MRGGVHDTFCEVTVHTAKCDICNRHNTSKMYRCVKCGRHICSPCWEKKGGDGRHYSHNKDNITYKGPRAPDLPSTEEPTMLKKSEELPSMRQTGRKRNRELRPSVSPTSSENVYAPTARTSQSIEHAMASGRKRRRQSNTEKTTNEDKSFRLPIHSPHAHGTVSQSTKLQRYLEGTTTTSDPNHEYNIDSAVDTLIDAAGSDTESETAEAPKVFRDHNGLNSIVKAIDLVESSSSPSCPSLTATPESINTTAVEAIQDDNKLPQLTPPWTPINEGHSISHHEVKAPLHTGLITPVSALFNCPQPASRSPLNVPSNHRSARLFDGGEAGRNEESRYTDRNHSHGYVQNAVHGARPPTNERNSLAKTSKHDA